MLSCLVGETSNSLAVFLAGFWWIKLEVGVPMDKCLMLLTYLSLRSIMRCAMLEPPTEILQGAEQYSFAGGSSFDIGSGRSFHI